MKPNNYNLKIQFKKFLPLLYSLIFIITIAIIIIIVKKSGYHIIYSATASMPQGLYLVIPTEKISHQDIVEFNPPPSALDFAKKNRWIPQSGSVIKYVFAIPNDHVCIHNQKILVNGKEIGAVAKFYTENKSNSSPPHQISSQKVTNKPLPQTNFCGKLRAKQYLLLSTKSERSFDGRYFGPVSLQRILGRAVPLF